MPSKGDPALSVVVVTRDHYGTLRPITAAVRGQTIADRIELVIAAPAVLAAQAPVFPYVEDDEFLIRERLGGRPLKRPEVAALVALLDSADRDGRR